MTKHAHASYESVTLELNFIIKPSWLHFKAGIGYQVDMCISFG